MSGRWRYGVAFLTAALAAGCAPGAAPAEAGAPDGAAAPSRTAEPPPATIDRSFRHVLRSEAIGEDYRIDVSLPWNPVEGDLPVVYVLDGNTNFSMIADAVRLMSTGNELPPMIVVGIGYVSDRVQELRARDLTPTFDAGFLDFIRQRGTPLPDDIRPGGGPRFLDFILDDVKPFIAETYPARENDSTLVGFSFGGLFTLATLFERPAAFERYVAGSPSIWWHEGVLFDMEAVLAEGRDDLDVDLFLSVGSLEQGAGNADADTARMVTNVHRMYETLAGRGYPGLRLTRHEFEGETHLSVIPATLSRGLRAVFAEPAQAPSR